MKTNLISKNKLKKKNFYLNYWKAKNNENVLFNYFIKLSNINN